MLNKFKSNLLSARVYLKEFLLFNISIVVIIYLIEDRTFIIIPLILIQIFISLLFLNLIGQKRNDEMSEIKKIIYNIRENRYLNSDEIKLTHYLNALEEEIKLMFEKTKSDIETLKKLEKMRTEFLGNVSHELRTPIFAIQGYIETLLEGAINDEKVNKNFLEKANHHTIRLNNLLNELIDISMIESGEMRLSFRYFDIKDFLATVVNEFKLMAEEKNIDLVLHPVEKEILVFGDKEKLRQVLTNLLTNSIKYTEEGKVEVLAEENKNFVKIIVRDTGYGIAEEDINRIFERFYRVDKARSKAAGGTGLGLAIVKHIIEAHSSKIEVKSKVGEGSEFAFRLKK